MGLVEEAQAAFRQSLADAEERKKRNFKEYESSSERCAVRFKPVRDVILAILDVSKEAYPEIRLTDYSSSIKLWGQHYDLTFDCYEIRKNENEFAGEYKYHLYMDISADSWFSLYFDEDEVAAVVYLTPKVLSDYMVYGTIPTHTIYYKINELNSTGSDNWSKKERLQREILEMVKPEERVLFAKTLSYFYFEGKDDDVEFDEKAGG